MASMAVFSDLTAVTMTTSVCSFSSLIRRRTSNPSMPGMRMSKSTRLTSRVLKIRRASGPLLAKRMS